jgi:hypothetical protein
MTLIRYQRIGLLVDSVLQQEVRDVSVNMDSKAQVVETITKGLSGFTPGAKCIEVEGKWALPVSGQEFDVATAISKGDVHQCQIPIGNKTIISSGIFMSGSISGAVNANTEVSAKFTGTYDDPA